MARFKAKVGHPRLPVWNAPSSLIIPYQDTYDFSARCSDPLGGTLTFSRVSGVGTVASNGIYTPDVDGTVVVRATNAVGSSDTTCTVDVTGNAPRVWTIADTPYNLGNVESRATTTAIDLLPLTTDPDGGFTDVFSVVSQTRNGVAGSYGVTINQTTGVMTLPANLTVGDSYSIVIGLSDGVTTVTRTFGFVIIEVQTSPVYNFGTPTHYASMTAVTNGAGTEVSPFTVEQALAFNPGGARCVIEFLPGERSVTTVSSRVNRPALQPTYSGTASNPLVFKARYAATNVATTPALRSVFHKPTGSPSGSILGVDGKSYVVFDGFEIRGGAIQGAANSSQGEVSSVSIWASTGPKVTRCLIDGENEGYVLPQAEQPKNFSGLYVQDVVNGEFADNLIVNIGAKGIANSMREFTGSEYYSCRGCSWHHNTIDYTYGHGIFEKGETSFPFSANRLHHNKISRAHDAAFFFYYHSDGPSLEVQTWCYQNLIVNNLWGCRDNGGLYGPIFVNNTVIGGAFSTGGVYFDLPRTAPCVYRNNVIASIPYAMYIEDGRSWVSVGGSTKYADHNTYYNVSTFMVGDSKSTFEQWKTLVGIGSRTMDVNGYVRDPLFTDTTTYKLQSGSLERLSGEDYLQLLGGVNTAPINRGCYITSDMSDAIGHRSNV